MALTAGPSEAKRLREVWRFLPTGSTSIDLASSTLDEEDARFPPLDHRPQLSEDSVLTSFAQLGALKLKATRAMVSLIDADKQYVLAEATSTTTLRANAKYSTGAISDLWLGNAVVPRYRTVCGKLLDEGLLANRVVVIEDLIEDERFARKSVVLTGPSKRFYASAPLCTPRGAVIGTFCVVDENPRPGGLSEQDASVLEDLASTMMDYLQACRVKEEHRRSDKLVRGLISFIDGAASLRTMRNQQQPDSNSRADRAAVQAVSPPDSENAIGAGFDDTALSPFDADLESAAPLEFAPQTLPSSDPIDPTSQLMEHDKLQPSNAPDLTQGADEDKESRISNESGLQDSILPPNARGMFERAANVLRQTSELDGVVIFDAAIAAVEHSSRSPKLNDNSVERLSSVSSRSSTSSEEIYLSSSENSTTTKNPKRRVTRMCRILGFSNTEFSSIEGDMANTGYVSLPESSLKRLLRSHPRGRIFNTGEDTCLSTSEDSDPMASSEGAQAGRDGKHSSRTSEQRSRRKRRIKSSIEALKIVAPNGQSLVFLPLWDYERSRWFACLVGWTSQLGRILSKEVDLLYTRAFGNSMMNELARLDAKASERTKTAFVASISHELRSPLHGILGATEFIGNTELDAFQTEMVGSIGNCGRTLLDTLDHVMDFAKIGQFEASSGSNNSYIQSKGANQIRMSARRSKTRSAPALSNLTKVFDISLATEEVLDSVFASQSYSLSYGDLNEDNSSAGFGSSMQAHNNPSTSSKSNIKRKNVRVVFDISQPSNWYFQMPPGVWRRILMNLVGNALKYTETGNVKVSLDSTKKGYGLNSGETQVILKVTDTGVGIASDFLVDKLFSAFAQQDSLSPGVGLGLHIVRQLVSNFGGSVNLRSVQGRGTEVIVKLPLLDANNERSNEASELEFKRIVDRVRGCSACILTKQVPTDLVDDGFIPTERHVRSPNESTPEVATSLHKTLTEWFGMSVEISESWNDRSCDFVICTEPSFELLRKIRSPKVSGCKIPKTIFVSLDALEAAALRDDVRIQSGESIVTVLTQPCGPNKLARHLKYCLNQQEMPSLTPSIELTEAELQPPRPFENSNIIQPLQLDHSATSSPAADLSRTETPPIGMKCMITDDNPINRRLLNTFMKKNGFPYANATNGQVAVDMYTSAPSSFNLILMDISMPVLDGMSATRQIRHFEKTNKLPRVRIVALTGLASNSTRLEAHASGVDEYLTKPIDFKALLELIEK